MAMVKYAAITIGSYELGLKIYQITADGKIKVTENVRQVMDLGRDTYSGGKLSFEQIEKLCGALEKFGTFLKEYRVTNVEVVASGIREAGNLQLILDHIRVKTGMEVRVLSNSEERFFDYKALYIYEKERKNFLEESTAYVDLGSGSMQISLVEKGSLVATQKLMLGSGRVREQLACHSDNMNHFRLLIDELVNNDWSTFKKMVLKDKKIKYIIATGLQISRFVTKQNDGKKDMVYSAEEFKKMCDGINAQKFTLPKEQALMLLPTARIYEKIIEETGAEEVWVPCTELPDGMVIDYAMRTKKTRVGHDFDEDILNSTKNISKRYKANQPHISNVRELAVMLFDATKKMHGMGARERLLLEISALLHDCGKYISITASPQCSYDIIMSTEIIGLSHSERELVADVVRYNTLDIEPETDLRVVKLTALLRTANALDRSHLQKFADVKTELKENRLNINVKTNGDLTLEKATFCEKADFFEEVFGIRPVIRQKRGV